MKINDILVTEINDLVTVGEKLSRDASQSRNGLDHERIQELSSISSRGGQLIRRLYGTDSQYMLNWQKVLDTPNFTAMHINYFKHISELVGILKGIQHDIKSGILSDLRRLINAEIFSDFLDMSEHLLNEGYKDAAAVILGAVLEDSLRKLADSNGIDTTTANGKPPTINTLNVALTKKGIYNLLVQKQITTWADLRNNAAHGHFNEYDIEQVKQMFLFVQKFCTDYLQ